MRPTNVRRPAVAAHVQSRLRGADPALHELRAQLSTVFTETFAQGSGAFKGGEVAEGGLAFPAKGAEVWNAFSPKVSESTQLRFKVRALADVKDVTILVWSDKLKDNARRLVGSIKKGETQEVVVRGIQFRAGWDAAGPSMEGGELNNFKIVFDGAPDARLVLSDVEVRQ